MIKLVVAVGFLAVFGVVGYAIVFLLAKSETTKKQNKKKEQNGTK